MGERIREKFKSINALDKVVKTLIVIWGMIDDLKFFNQKDFEFPKGLEVFTELESMFDDLKERILIMGYNHKRNVEIYEQMIEDYKNAINLRYESSLFPPPYSDD